jgi:hypothetical protein
MEIPVNTFSRLHLSNGRLMQGFTARVAQDRSTTAELLADMAEIEKRRLYVPAGYSSMYAWCLSEHHMSESMAYKRIHAARAARRYPAIFAAVEDGRLHLSAVVTLAPYLTPETASELLAAAAHKTRGEIQQMLATRFPQPDRPTLVQVIGPAAAAVAPTVAPTDVPAIQLPPGAVVTTEQAKSAVTMEPLRPQSKPEPLAPGRYAVQFTMDEEMHGDLRAVQTMLGHALPSGDIKEVLRRALHELRAKLEKQKFAATGKPRPQRVPANGRHIPASVKRAVWERDQGRCTFVGEHGKRCESRTRIEFDHVEAVARGGQATVRGVRLLCHAHNQYAAERVFGPAFMDGKREQGRERTDRARDEAEARAARALLQPSALSCTPAAPMTPA